LFSWSAFAQQNDDGKSFMSISGIVRSGGAPLAGAVVCGSRWGTSTRLSLSLEHCATTDQSGTYTIESEVVTDGREYFIEVIAAATDHRSETAMPIVDNLGDVDFNLNPLPAEDNIHYEWLTPDDCGGCHTRVTQEGRRAAHSIAARDSEVMQMYEGTDASGNPAVAPGYKLDHDDAGECGACHAATASWELGQTVDLGQISAPHDNGVYCETCHKIRCVNPDGAPGTEGSIELWRPGADDNVNVQLFAFGPWPNVTDRPMGSSYSPLFREAKICAGCHEYENRNGVKVMDTYTDWTAVGDTATTVPCQGCHMRNNFEIPAYDVNAEYFVDGHVRQMHGTRRNADDLAQHYFPGGEALATHALEFELIETFQDGDELVVKTQVINVGANHRVPTGMPFREVALAVSATVANGSVGLAQVSGPTLSTVRGGPQAGLPGKTWAKTLGDKDGQATYAFWDATSTLEDNRLAPGVPETQEFRFSVPGDATAQVSARLVYRRFARDLAQQKGWDHGEQELARADATVELKNPAQGGCNQASGLHTRLLWLGVLVFGIRAWRRRRGREPGVFGQIIQ